MNEENEVVIEDVGDLLVAEADDGGAVLRFDDGSEQYVSRSSLIRVAGAVLAHFGHHLKESEIYGLDIHEALD